MCIWVAEKHTFHMLPISFEWLFPPGQGLALTPSIPFTHFFISQFPSFIFTIRIARTQGRPAIPSCSCALNYHNSYNHFFLSLHQIHFRMNDAENKNRNPQKSRTCTLSQNLLLGVKPISLCEANEQDSFFKAALMHESELVNCETTPSERGLEHTAEATTCALTHTLIWILFETILWLLRGHEKSTCVSKRCHARHELERENRLPAVTIVEVASV